MDYTKLTLEVTTDPLVRGYAVMTNQQVANSLNNVKDRPGADRTVIDAHEIIEATVPADWAGLTAAEKQRYQTLTGAGQVNLKGANTRAALAAMFGAGTQTRTNIVALQAGPPQSRAEELGLGDVVGDGHVASVRGQ